MSYHLDYVSTVTRKQHKNSKPFPVVRSVENVLCNFHRKLCNVLFSCLFQFVRKFFQQSSGTYFYHDFMFKLLHAFMWTHCMAIYVINIVSLNQIINCRLRCECQVHCESVLCVLALMFHVQSSIWAAICNKPIYLFITFDSLEKYTTSFPHIHFMTSNCVA